MNLKRALGYACLFAYFKQNLSDPKYLSDSLLVLHLPQCRILINQPKLPGTPFWKALVNEIKNAVNCSIYLSFFYYPEMSDQKYLSAMHDEVVLHFLP